jgi:hypothetical protein
VVTTEEEIANAIKLFSNPAEKSMILIARFNRILAGRPRSNPTIGQRDTSPGRNSEQFAQAVIFLVQ